MGDTECSLILEFFIFGECGVLRGIVFVSGSWCVVARVERGATQWSRCGDLLKILTKCIATLHNLSAVNAYNPRNVLEHGFFKASQVTCCKTDVLLGPVLKKLLVCLRRIAKKKDSVVLSHQTKYLFIFFGNFNQNA